MKSESVSTSDLLNPLGLVVDLMLVNILVKGLNPSLGSL
jgi:hypothetical protein